MSLLAHTSPLEHAVIVAIAAVSIGLYGEAWLHGRVRRNEDAWRLWAWTAGTLAVVLATTTTVERWAAESFSGHMVQHLLMIVVAAPLLVLARPVRTLERRWRPGRAHGSTSRRVRAWWRGVGPLVAPVAFVGTLFVTHLTGIYDAALSNRAVHDGEHLVYLAAACGLWSVGLGAGRTSAAARIGAVFGVIGGSALLGVVLLSAPSPLVPTYAERLGVEAALDDQRVAASLMWVGGMAITLPLLIVAVWRCASAEERAAQRLESFAREPTGYPRRHDLDTLRSEHRAPNR